MNNNFIIFVILLIVIVISFYFIFKSYRKKEEPVNDLLTNGDIIIQNALRDYNNENEKEDLKINNLSVEDITEDNKKILDFNNAYFNMYDRINNTTDNFNNSIDNIKLFNFDVNNIKIKDIYNTIVN